MHKIKQKQIVRPQRRPMLSYIDSICFSENNIEDKFNLYSELFHIEPMKGIGVFEPLHWRNEFGKIFTKNIVCAKCVFTIYGYSLPLKRYSASKNKLMQTIEFAGLRKFDEKALYLNKIIQILKNHLINSYIPRIDIALDFLNKLPKWIDNNIKKLRPKIETVKNTIYFMGKKQIYRSSTMDIKCYPKYIKDKLSKKIIRLEFVFKGRYTKGFQYKNIKNLYVKIINTIKKFTGLDVTIKPI